MSDEQFNLDLRRFLKRFGVGAQQAIEAAVRQAQAAGALEPGAVVKVRARLEIDGVEVDYLVEDELHVG